MTVTTALETWVRVVGAPSVGQTVRDCLGEFARDFDAAAVEDDFRSEINAALAPHDIVLCGDDFIGGDTSGELIRMVIREVVRDVNIWPIIERHDHSHAA